MKRRVMIKFFGKEIEALDKFARDVGLQPDDLVKKCLWKCLREAYTVEPGAPTDDSTPESLGTDQGAGTSAGQV